MAEVADLFATLGLKVKQAEWASGDAAMSRAERAAATLGQRFVNAGNALRGVAPAAREAGSAGESAGHRIAGGFDAAGAAVKGYLAYLGGSFAYDKLIRANHEYEDNTISLAAMIQGSLGGSFEKATERAKELNTEFQRFDMAGAPAKTSEITEFANNIAAATFAAGGGIKDLIALTEKGVIAGKVFAGNRGAGYASLELSEMLMGNVSNRMMMVRQLLAGIHMSEETFRGLDDKGRLKATLQAVNTQALNDASGAFAGSFSGIETSVVSRFEIMARKIGEKLFARLKESMSALNKWLEENEEQIQKLGDTISNVLVTAFNGLVKTIQFLSQHGSIFKGIMIALGAVLLATAIRATIAWAAFLGPIGLIVAAVAGLAAIVIEYWDDISEAFSRVCDYIADKAHAAGAAIKKAFTAAFDWIADQPGIKQIIEAMEWAARHATGAGYKPGESAVDDAAHAIGSGMTPAEAIDAAGRKELTRTLASPAQAGAAAPVAVSVSMGDIHVNAPNADAGAVADQVNKTIGDHLGSLFRRTLDEVA